MRFVLNLQIVADSQYENKVYPQSLIPEQAVSPHVQDPTSNGKWEQFSPRAQDPIPLRER